MSRPLYNIKNFPTNRTMSRCQYCGGSGCLVIKNAYDPTYKEVEPCVKCGGSGVESAPVDKYGPN